MQVNWKQALTAVGVLGGTYFAVRSILKSSARAKLWKIKRNVVITGSTLGIGNAMAKRFLEAGDSVVISGRSQDKVDQVVKELDRDFPGKVFGCACDVSKPDQVTKLAEYAKEKLGYVHIWVNNAGVSESPRGHLLIFPPEQIINVVQTNLIGVILCTQAALKLMKDNIDPQNPKLHHIFNMDGGGSNGMSTPTYSVYGATKRALPQFMKSVVAANRTEKITVGVHTISPGMVITDMLMNYGNEVTNSTKAVFNILAELPSTTSKWLVGQIRSTSNCTGTYPKFLTIPGGLLRFATAPLRRGKIFDSQGNFSKQAELELRLSK
jgi:chlorophyll(ide) b reductase